MFHPFRASPQSPRPMPSAAWTDYTPTGPWADGQIVTRNADGVGFTYSASLNALTVVANSLFIAKNANNFPINNLPAPSSGGDAANKTYVDSHGGGGLADAPSDGTLYGRENAGWVNAVPLGGGTMTGLLILSASPSATLGAATKGYVDTAVGGVAIPPPSSTVPGMDGTGAAGSATAYARGDHIHPTDTTRAPLASPTFTGTPAAPTPTSTDNSTTLATTQFVKAQGYIIANQTITLSGDVTGSGTTAITATLATVNPNVGTFQGITVNGKGLVTGAINMNYAPLASPTFTGVPAAPTATALTNTTQIATTAYADSAVAVEKSRAQTAEALLAPIASPTLTGTPAAPTATAGDNSTLIATTAFVTTAVAGGGGGGGLPSGTVILFYQAAVPTGWTKVTTQNDKALRVVSGTGGVTGGTNAFSTVMAQTVVGSDTPNTSKMAAHAHTVGGGLNTIHYNVSGGGGAPMPGGSGGGTGALDGNGGGSAHNHTISMSIQYCDVILGSKN